MNSIKLANTDVGLLHQPYFIADIGANHDGDLNRAFKLIELAKESGAHAAKFQNFKAPKIVSKKGFEKLGQKLSHQSKWKKSVYEVYEDASISEDWTIRLKEKCDQFGIEYFTSPYDFESVDAVDPFVQFYKIGSGDITWLEIIEYIGRKGKPVLIATGASDIVDVKRAMQTLQKVNNEIVLMQCNTNYTGSSQNFKFINLRVLETFKKLYPNIVLGLSDHSSGHAAVLGAIALRARVIEKHFTDDNLRIGPDHKFAMNPMAWRQMVDRANELFYALGDGIKRVEENEKETALVQRRALRYNFNLETGHILQDEDIIAVRPIPEEGIPPYEKTNLIGKNLVVDVLSDDLVTMEHFRND